MRPLQPTRCDGTKTKGQGPIRTFFLVLSFTKMSTISITIIVMSCWSILALSLFDSISRGHTYRYPHTSSSHSSCIICIKEETFLVPMSWTFLQSWLLYSINNSAKKSIIRFNLHPISIVNPPCAGSSLLSWSMNWLIIRLVGYQVKQD